MPYTFDKFKLCFEVDEQHISTLLASTRPAIGEEWIVPSLGQSSRVLKVIGVRVMPPPRGEECLVFCQCEFVKD